MFVVGKKERGQYAFMQRGEALDGGYPCASLAREIHGNGADSRVVSVSQSGRTWGKVGEVDDRIDASRLRDLRIHRLESSRQGEPFPSVASFRGRVSSPRCCRIRTCG